MAGTAYGLNAVAQLVAIGDNAEWRRVISSAPSGWRRKLYHAYLDSSAWKRKRNERMAIDHKACYLCHSMDKLSVHHVTYSKLGDEDVQNDLRTLCLNCHRVVHDKESNVQMIGTTRGLVALAVSGVAERPQEARRALAEARTRIQK